MGCGASNSGPMVSNMADPTYVEVTSAWDRAWQTTGVKKGTKIKMKNLVVKRSGWKTIRIFVSSTFRDFHQEREVLIKKVFPDLRLWCEAHRLRLIECDLRWGVPKDVTTEGTLRACLGEIDRCYHDNVMPFFINMTSERVGWIPKGEEVPEGVSEEYKWVEGLSVTEMEIMHAAYRIDNPNALFMLRDSSFLDSVPEEYKKAFVESKNPQAPVKLDMLRKMIHERFPPKRIHNYKVEFRGFNPDTNLVELGGMESFGKIVFDFFKERISAQYPLNELAKSSIYEHACEQHESFMKNKADCVFGRGAILNEIDEYICSPGADVPYLLIGGAGSGKSSIMARIADQTTLKALNKQIPGARGKDWTVFYHFVGAVPGSTDLEKTLKRLLLEMKVCNESKMPKDLENTAHMTCGALNNPNTRPTIIFIDALNQFDSDNMAEVVNWVPRKLAPQVRCIFSMIPDTPHHTAFMKREPIPKILQVTPLDHETKETIVTEMLGKYNKRLDDEQLETLLSKSSSSNPLWLSIAVEELRVFGQFRKILDKINMLADGLLELEIQIIERFEQEAGTNLIIATLCMMEVSSHGLLETELLGLLADEEHLIMPEADKDADTEKGDASEKAPSSGQTRLPAQKWAEVYRNLKPFLRPFGESGEGRLDFYHRSLSKAVRKKYFKDEEGNDRSDVYNWWHGKLVTFFEQTSDFGRQVEEYPVHLVATKDHTRLEKFLTNWAVFDALFDEEYSSRLVNLWRTSVGFDRMEECYMTELRNFTNSGTNSKDAINKRTIVMAKFLIQAGRLKAADGLLKKSLKIEETELGARPEHMVELYQTIARNADEIQKMEGYYDQSQIPMITSIIENFEKAIAIRETLTGERNKMELGNILNRTSFYYSELKDASLGEEIENVTGPAECNKRAKERIEEAIKIFKELNDEAHVADCLITKGVSFDRGQSEQLKCYKEAEEMLLRTVGEIHHSMTRVYLNIGVYYEDHRNYSEAFNYFYKWYQLIVELYGKEHSRSIRAIETLREPLYARYCRQKGIDVPELAAGGNESD